MGLLPIRHRRWGSFLTFTLFILRSAADCSISRVLPQQTNRSWKLTEKGELSPLLFSDQFECIFPCFKYRECNFPTVKVNHITPAAVLQMAESLFLAPKKNKQTKKILRNNTICARLENKKRGHNIMKALICFNWDCFQ